jgi:hypothetical protein
MLRALLPKTFAAIFCASSVTFGQSPSDREYLKYGIYNAPQRHTEFYRYNSPRDLPNEELMELANGAARSVISRWVLYDARVDLDQTVRDLVGDFENSPEVLELKRRVEEANRTIARSRVNAIRALASDPDFVRLVRAQEELSSVLRELPAGGSVRTVSADSGRWQLAHTRLEVSSQTSAMIREAMEQDPQYRTAKEVLAQTTSELNRMRSEFQRTMRRTDVFVAARNAVRQARYDMVGAHAYLQHLSDHVIPNIGRYLLLLRANDRFVYPAYGLSDPRDVEYPYRRR